MSDLGSAPREQAASTRASRWVLAAGVVLAVAVVAALTALAWRDRMQTLRAQQDQLELTVRALEHHVTRSLESVSLACGTLVELASRGVAPGSAMLDAASQQTLVNLPYVRSLAWLDGSGAVLASTDPADVGAKVPLALLGSAAPPGPESMGPLVAGRGLKDLAAAEPRDPVPAGVGFLPLIRQLAHPSLGTLVLVALVNIDAFANFQEVALSDGTGEGASAVALTTYSGQVLAATSRSALAPGQDVSRLAPFTQFLPRLEHGHWQGEGLRPGSQVAAFRVLRSRPMVVLAERSQSAVLQLWQRQAAVLAVLGALMLLAIVGSTLVASRSLRSQEAARAERDAAQADVARREHELSVIFRSVQELLFRTDSQGRLSFLNLRRDPLTQRPTDDLLGLPLHEVVTADTAQAVRDLFAAGPEVNVRRAQARLQGPDGASRWFDVAVVPLLDNAVISGFAGSAVDVTEIRAAQAQLQSQLAFTESLTEGNPLPIALLDLQGRYLRINRAWEVLTRRPRSELLGTAADAELPSDESELHRHRDRELLSVGTELRYEAQRHLPDGTLRDLLVSKSLVRDAGGRASGIVVVLMDITDVREAERTTREARDVALKASLAKTEFMANVSHELRTPLQSILGFSELGQRRAKTQEVLAGMFEDIHRSGKRMLGLVNDLLDLTRAESHEMSMSFEFLDIRGLVREVCRELRPLSDGRTLTLALDLPREPLVTGVDALRFQQVVRNVLANAIRFSPLGGQIDIALLQDQIGGVLLTVSDRGPGVPEDELESIFDAFIQSSRTKDGSGGTGLGLAISRRIMQAHGGAITAMVREGGGSVFRVWLPGRDTPAALVFE